MKYRKIQSWEPPLEEINEAVANILLQDDKITPEEVIAGAKAAEDAVFYSFYA